MYGRIAHGMPGGGNLWLGIIGLILTALLTAATIIAILMLIDVARNRGVKVEGGRLAGFWIVGLVLTPITLALYVLCLKPAPAHAAPTATAGVPAIPMGPVAPTDPAADPVAGGPQDPASETSRLGVAEETLVVNEGPTTVIDGPSA